jgi:hypothetical protein
VAYDARLEIAGTGQFDSIERLKSQLGSDWSRAVRDYRLLGVYGASTFEVILGNVAAGPPADCTFV